MLMTFMTHKSYGKTAKALDDRRLGNQRVEAWTIFDALTSGQSIREPAARMWSGYEYALGVYTMMLCMEWTNVRGCADKIFFHVYRAIKDIKRQDPDFTYEAPPWIADIDVLRSHRSVLIRHEEIFSTGDHYARTFPKTGSSLPCLWPIVDANGSYVLKISKDDRSSILDGSLAVDKKLEKRIVNL